MHTFSKPCTLISRGILDLLVITLELTIYESGDNTPIRPVQDVSWLGLYLLFFNDFLIRRPVKSWGPAWIFFERPGNISLAGTWPSERRQPATFQPILSLTKNCKIFDPFFKLPKQTTLLDNCSYHPDQWYKETQALHFRKFLTLYWNYFFIC